MANLALSEEEIEVLKNVRFPFFVSGLAGSGKSTILYYLLLTYTSTYQNAIPSTNCFSLVITTPL